MDVSNMISGPIINLGLVGLTCFMLIIYLMKFVFKYKHQYESNPLCTITVLFCLLIVLLSAFVLPVDIFLVSFIKNSDGTFKQWATKETLAKIDTAFNATYYSLYGIICILVSVVIPFLHFFNEESVSNSRDRLHRAIQYTFGFVLILVLLMLIGAYLEDGTDPNTIFDKIFPAKDITKAERAALMVLSILTILGFNNVMFYTASGLFSWPLGLLLGTSSVSRRYDTVVDQGDVYRVRVNQLRDKARTTRLSDREQEQLDRAEEDLRRLDREETVLSSYSSSWSYKLRNLIRPIQIIVGLFSGALSLILVATLTIVNIDRILHSTGWKDGYVLLRPTIFNPFEYICTKAQDLIFIGPLPILIVTTFLVIATISGIRNLGLWLIFTRLHRIKVARTQPQALLYFCITMMLAATSLNLTLYSLAPQYITFGNQNFRSQGPNNTTLIQPCTIDDYHGHCIMTRSSMFLIKMISQEWFIGAIFYWQGWVFVVVSTISFIAYLKRGKREAAHDMLAANDEFEE